MKSGEDDPEEALLKKTGVIVGEDDDDETDSKKKKKKTELVTAYAPPEVYDHKMSCVTRILFILFFFR